MRVVGSPAKESQRCVHWYYKCIVNRGIRKKAFCLTCWTRGKPAHMAKAGGRTIVRWKALFSQ